MDWLTDPLQFDFFVRALAAVVLVSVLCALVGAWVVLRGLSYIGDAMSHAVLPGLVGALLTGGNLIVGAIVAAVLTALGIGAVGQRSGLKQDSAIGIVFVGMFALGVGERCPNICATRTTPARRLWAMVTGTSTRTISPTMSRLSSTCRTTWRARSTTCRRKTDMRRYSRSGSV